jgi:hypothetical protein
MTGVADGFKGMAMGRSKQEVQGLTRRVTRREA